MRNADAFPIAPASVDFWEELKRRLCMEGIPLMNASFMKREGEGIGKNYIEVC
jgi:hypothetical protein